MRCIDADKLHYKKVYIESKDYSVKSAVVVFAKEIDKMPTFEVIDEANWVLSNNYYICSNCRQMALKDLNTQDFVFSRYCPSCGRKMVNFNNV